MAVYDYVILTGVIIPDIADIAAQVAQEFTTAFGTSLNLSPNTPQGVLYTVETLAREAVARNNATLANQINPNEAGGQFLDAIGLLTNSQRNPQQFSTISGVLLNGVPGTVIPTSDIYADSVSGAQFSPLNSVTLDSSGAATVEVIALVAGPINVSANNLTVIVSAVDGLETVTNPSAAIPGSLTQTDEAYRLYRRNTLALQGQALSEAIISGLTATPGVRSLKYQENVTEFTVIINGITMVPHSIWACVDGGSDIDVATTMLNKKSGGCNYNGAVTVDVTDPASGQIYPVSFDRPTVVSTLARVTVSANASVPDPINSVISAILAYAQGLLNDEPGLTVGTSVSPFEYAGAINQQAPSIFVHKVEVSYASVISYVTTELPINVNQIASIVASSITVNIV